jgi:hypothetical protein
MEGLLMAWWSILGSYSDVSTKLTEIRWHRVGAGITPPNPAERSYILPTPSAGAGTAIKNPPQTACSITFRTAVRRSWGRTYLPFDGGGLNTQHRLSSTQVDQVASSTNTLITNAASSDFHLVVTSIKLSASLNVEKIEVDDVTDIIRRRRWKHTTYRKILP